MVNEEDTIEIRDKSKQLAFIDIALANKERETPEYISMDEKNIRQSITLAFSCPFCSDFELRSRDSRMGRKWVS